MTSGRLTSAVGGVTDRPSASPTPATPLPGPSRRDETTSRLDTTPAAHACYRWPPYCLHGNAVPWTPEMGAGSGPRCRMYFSWRREMGRKDCYSYTMVRPRRSFDDAALYNNLHITQLLTFFLGVTRGRPPQRTGFRLGNHALCGSRPLVTPY